MTIAASEAPKTRMARGSLTIGICLSMLVLIAVVSLTGPLLSPYSVDQIDFDQSLISPTPQDARLFGTDDLGRDLFVRTMKGTQMTLFVAFVASVVSLVIGVIYGAVAGYAGGKIDALMMRAVDALYAMPFMFFVILLMVVFGRSLFADIYVAIGAINWLDTARIVRGQTLSLKAAERSWMRPRLTGVSSFGHSIRGTYRAQPAWGRRSCT